MSMIDPERERQRLTERYGAMTDGELEKLAAESGGLGDVAREALQSELQRRGGTGQFQPESPWTEVEHHPLVTIRKFRDLPEALLAKGWLESAGIEAFLSNENMVRLDWFISNLVGGVGLQVRAEDQEQALEIMEQPIPEEFEVEGVGEYRQPRCPECQSLDINFPGSNTGAAFASAYMSVPLPFQNANWKCRACGAEWSSDPETAQPEQLE